MAYLNSVKIDMYCLHDKKKMHISSNHLTQLAPPSVTVEFISSIKKSRKLRIPLNSDPSSFPCPSIHFVKNVGAREGGREARGGTDEYRGAEGKERREGEVRGKEGSLRKGSGGGRKKVDNGKRIDRGANESKG